MMNVKTNVYSPLYSLSLFLLLTMSFAVSAQQSKPAQYDVVFSAKFIPERGVAEASIKVSQTRHLLRLLDLNAPEGMYQHFSGDGEIIREDSRLIWQLPESGGVLKYEVLINHHRGSKLDAKMTDDWAVLRLEQLFPPARIRSKRGSESRSVLEFYGPKNWRFESRFRVRDGRISINNADRKFDSPTGWMSAGKLGVRRETIANRKVTVAAPIGQEMRRMDILALLRWTLPKLVNVFPDFPDRVLIIGAKDGMWRGGLSGPGSIYVHADRPLISENSTSTVIHELVHTATKLAGTQKEDWIVEGMAEYYSLELLRRSGSISKKRFKKALQNLGNWANRENGQLKTPSSGADTARAVMVFDLIQGELASRDMGSMDSIIRKLMDSNNINSERLIDLTEKALGSRFDELRVVISQNKEGAIQD